MFIIIQPDDITKAKVVYLMSPQITTS